MKRYLFLLIALLLAPDGAAREDAQARREKRVARLFAMLGNARPNYRAKAAEMLGRLDVQGAAEKLLERLKDDDGRVRSEAARALGRLRCADAVDPVIGLLDDAEGEVVIGAIVALGQMGQMRAIKPILARLDGDSKRWLPIAVALGRIGDKQGLPALKRIYDAVPNGKDKADVAASIGRIQPALGIELISKLAKDQDTGVVFAALRAAGEMNHPVGARFLLEKVLRLRSLYDAAGPELARDALAAAIGSIRDEKLLHGFVDEARREKRTPEDPSDKLILVLRAIAASGHPKMYADVYPFLKDPEQDVRLAAISAAGRVGDERALETLLGYLRDADFVVVVAAAEALGDLGHDSAIDPLILRLEDPDYRVRFAAAKALARLRCEDVVEPLIRALETAADWLPKELAAVLQDVTGQDLLSGAAGWRGWYEKNQQDFRVWYEEDHAK